MPLINTREIESYIAIECTVVTYALLTVFPNFLCQQCCVSFLGKAVGRVVVVGPTLIVLAEGETALSKCLGCEFDSLAWQHAVPTRTLVSTTSQ
jgi:hypothetical protein